MITNHPSDALMLDYAAGSLGEAMALAVASHASLCGVCGERVRKLEDLGGELLEEVDPAGAGGLELTAVLARLDEPEPAVSPQPHFDAETMAILPPPLRRYVGRNLKEMRWRRIAGMYEEALLSISRVGLKVSFMRLRPGAFVPLHSHRGQEITLVLAGGYSDSGRAFIRGDFDASGPARTHRPIVDKDEGCLCFVVLDAPVRLTGVLGALVNPFLRV